jgi:hypothetical protein
MNRLVLLIAATAAWSYLTPAVAQQDVRVQDLRASVFLERSGRLSDDLLKMPGAKLVNMPHGQGEFGEPANTVVFMVVLSGQRNTTPKYAAAVVNITQTGRTGQKTVSKRALEGFAFGPEGTVIRPVVLENATCQSIEIEVKTQRSAKTATLAFECPETARTATTAQSPRR